MTDLTNTPAWVREIAERESKATAGPWEDVNGNTVFRGEECIAITPEGGLSVMDTDFIAHSRTDIPRLIEAAAGMAEGLEGAIIEAQGWCSRLRDYMRSIVVADANEYRAECNQYCASCELGKRCRIPAALQALAKYRGEVGK